MPSKKWISTMPMIPLAASAVVVGQIIHTARRRDLPSYDNQDPSGDFGDPGLPRLRMVALGDSSITAPGVEDLDESFIRRIALHLADRYRVELRSVAAGGSKSRDVLADQLDRAITLEPDIALLSVGGNDAIRGTPVSRYEAELHRIVASLHESAKAVALMGVGDLGTVPRLPPNLRWLMTSRAKSIDAANARVATRFPRLARSEYWEGESLKFTATDLSLFAGDRFHASGAGHALFAADAIPAVEAVLPYLNGSRASGSGPGAEGFDHS